MAVHVLCFCQSGFFLVQTVFGVVGLCTLGPRRPASADLAGGASPAAAAANKPPERPPQFVVDRNSAGERRQATASAAPFFLLAALPCPAVSLWLSSQQRSMHMLAMHTYFFPNTENGSTLLIWCCAQARPSPRQRT